MAKVAAHGTRIWVDEFALTSYLNSSTLKTTQETPDVTCFGDAGPRRLVANYDHTGDHNGLFDGADGAIDDLVKNALATDEDHYILQAFGSGLEGARAYERVMRLADQPRSAQVGQAALLNFMEEGSNNAVRAAILRSAAITGTGNGTGQNLGATSAGQLTVATFRILSVSGSGSITLQIHESQNDGGGDAYASIAALASGAMTAVGVVRKTTTGATEAWKRVTVSAFSGFSSVTILVSIGVAPNTP